MADTYIDLGKPELLPLIFDDVAEVHKTSGTTTDGDAPEPAPPA